MVKDNYLLKEGEKKLRAKKEKVQGNAKSGEVQMEPSFQYGRVCQ